MPASLPTVEHWCDVVMSIYECRRDVTSVADWAAMSSLTPSMLRQVCRLAGVIPRDTLLLARLLRATVVAPHACCGIADLLEVYDERTLRRIARLACVDMRCIPAPTTHEFLDSQRIVTRPVLIRCLTIRVSSTVDNCDNKLSASDSIRQDFHTHRASRNAV